MIAHTHTHTHIHTHILSVKVQDDSISVDIKISISAINHLLVTRGSDKAHHFVQWSSGAPYDPVCVDMKGGRT